MNDTREQLLEKIAELNAALEQLEARCWRLKADYIEMQRAWENMRHDLESLNLHRGNDA